jgi:hypothetical protein
MPGFVDQVTIDGKTQNIVWMPSLFPPRGSANRPEEGGGDQISGTRWPRTGPTFTQGFFFSRLEISGVSYPVEP